MASIFTVEAMAFIQALQSAIESAYNKIRIFSDSMSSQIWWMWNLIESTITYLTYL